MKPSFLWTKWLSFAIIAEKYCLEASMSKENAREFLLRQKPEMVEKFATSYRTVPKNYCRSPDGAYVLNAGSKRSTLSEGCYWTKRHIEGI